MKEWLGGLDGWGWLLGAALWLGVTPALGAALWLGVALRLGLALWLDLALWLGLAQLR